MTWLQIILLLACPLMMLFCMRGMFSGNKCEHMKHNHQGASSTEIQKLQDKMTELVEQNQSLKQEIQSMKMKASSTKEA